MTATLPSLKRAALQLIGDLRPDDSAAVYGFNDRVIEFQPFTTDKSAMKRGVLRAHPAGPTALYDALVRVSRDLMQRHGKKVIVVFTDGSDNSSMLTADAAIFRAKSSGIPIYTIAQGEARQHPALIKGLADLSHATGGAPFLIRKLADIGAAFHQVSEDLMHGYLLAIQPPPAAGKAWNPISVSIPGLKGVTIRARDGYNVE
jgi:Ca-activated chloride channel homolog